MIFCWQKCQKQKNRLLCQPEWLLLKKLTTQLKLLEKTDVLSLQFSVALVRIQAKPEEMHLKGMNVLRKIYSVPVGVSDHSLGMGVSVAAAALGANVIEKHIMLPGEKDSRIIASLWFRPNLSGWWK